jgi:acyl-CoA thioesterase-1
MSNVFSEYLRIRLAGLFLLGWVLVAAGCGTPAADNGAAAPSEPPAESALPVEPDSASAATRILFLGDSITAGLGVDQTEAFPARVGMQLKQEGYSVAIIDAGVSGDTSTGGLNRLSWLLQNRVDILVLELGGNDGLRGIDLNLTRSSLGSIITQTREAWPGVDVVLVGMQVPPNLGTEYTATFARMYPELAAEYDTEFIPFVGDSFEDILHLLQNDGIHPTAEGHALIAEKVLATARPLVATRQPK